MNDTDHITVKASGKSGVIVMAAPDPYDVLVHINEDPGHLFRAYKREDLETSSEALLRQFDQRELIRSVLETHQYENPFGGCDCGDFSGTTAEFLDIHLARILDNTMKIVDAVNQLVETGGEYVSTVHLSHHSGRLVYELALNGSLNKHDRTDSSYIWRRCTPIEYNGFVSYLRKGLLRLATQDEVPAS